MSATDRTFEPSKYQKAIFEAGTKGTRNIVVNATAGSGKTKTIQVFIKDYMPKGKNWIYLVFNKRNQEEAKTKLAGASNGYAVTFHSLGLSTIQRNGGRVNVDTNKAGNILKQYILKEERDLFSPVLKLVSIVKNTLTDYNSDEELISLCERYSLEMNGSAQRIFQLARNVLNGCLADMNIVDFDDMIWFPTLLHMNFQTYDYVLVDECQDLNKAQVQMVLAITKPNGCTMVIGDRNQAIYGFRGAGIDAMDILSKELNAIELPLSITYRNPKAIVALVNKTFPNIVHEVSPTAPEGKVQDITYTEFWKIVRPNDMILCRTNAPLVNPAFALIRRGIKAVIVGKSIGEELENLIKKITKDRDMELNEFFSLFSAYYQKQRQRLMDQGKERLAQALDDKYETIMVLAEECDTLDEIIHKINTIFSDVAEGVVFSTTHRAKGLEAKNIFIIRYDLMPHPLALRSGNAWAIREEDNCKFVALTRSLNNLYFVTGA
jgi:superfamily I DNA/RNA helicase